MSFVFKMVPSLDGPAVVETGRKGNKVDLNTFKKGRKDDIIGHKMIEEGRRKFVNFVRYNL